MVSNTKICCEMNEDSKTIATLIKLLVINMVASNFLGRSRSLSTESDPFVFDSSSSCLSRVESEKNATSEPLTIAEQKRSTKVASKLRIMLSENPSEETNKSHGKGSIESSNSYNFVLQKELLLPLS